jgi:hypothetical protein
MGKIIEWLSGKKTTIATIVGALIVFALGRGYIQQDIAELVSAIMLALGLTANIATAKHYAKVNEEVDNEITSLYLENDKLKAKLKKK